MSGTLLTRRAVDMAPVWRQYWLQRWIKLPPWPAPRLARLLSASLGRKAIKERKRALTRPPLVADFPDGRSPFLGVVGLGQDGNLASDAGVLQFPMKGHLLTVAPTRTGKGTCQIIPNLLLYGGSAFVIDVKGENYAITARRREQMFRHSRVLRFAPLEADSAQYNPLDFVRTMDTGISVAETFDDARLLASMLLPQKTREEYWDVEARNLLTLLLMYTAVRYLRDDPSRTMRTVMNLLFPAPAEDEREGSHGLRKVIDHILVDARTLQEPILVSLASSFLEHESRVFSNIASTCRAAMQIWHSPNLLRATEASDFSFSDLKASMCRPIEANPSPTTLYIVIPPQNLREYRGVVRMMVGLAIAELTRPAQWASWQDWRPSAPCDVLFLLDELPTLGHMGPVVDGLAYLAGYGIKIWSFVQNMGQLKEIYRDEAHNFTANAGAMCFFGVNDPETAEYVEKQLGETNEYSHYYDTTSSSTSRSNSIGEDSWTSSDSSSESVTTNVRFVREPIAKAAEIRAIDPDLQFIFIRNTPPILATKMPYYDFRGFDGLYDTWSGG